MRLRKSIPFDLCPEIGETLYPEHHADIKKTTCQAGGFVYAAFWQEDRCALFCVQPVPLAELLQLKGQLGAAHNGVVVVVKVFVVVAGQRAGFLRRDDAELGEN